MSYVDTFITVSADCPASCGLIPGDKKEVKSKPGIEYELLSNNPYTYTHEDLIYEVHLRHKSISEEETAARGTQIRDELFRSPIPACVLRCFRKNTAGGSITIPKEKSQYMEWNLPSTGNS